MTTLRDELPAIRTEVLDYLPDQGVIDRTSQTLANLRVATGKGYVRLRELPAYMRLQQWTVTVPDGVDIEVGDRVTVTGGVTGIYLVIYKRDPVSYTFYISCECVKVNDSGRFPALGQLTASFRSQSNDNDVITGVQVYLRPEFRQPMPGESSISFDYLVTWNDTVTFSDGRKPDLGDWMVCPALDVPRNEAQLDKPARANVPRPTATAMLRLVI